MILQTNKTDIEESRAKIINGVNKALKKLVEKSAANNESLIIGNKDGSFKSVPAKELLVKLSE